MRGRRRKSARERSAAAADGRYYPATMLERLYERIYTLEHAAYVSGVLVEGVEIPRRGLLLRQLRPIVRPPAGRPPGACGLAREIRHRASDRDEGDPRPDRERRQCMHMDIDAYKALVSPVRVDDIDFDVFRDEPLSPPVLRCLRYMHDVELHTVCYLRDLLVTSAHRDPRSPRS